MLYALTNLRGASLYNRAFEITLQGTEVIKQYAVRCDELILVDDENNRIATHRPDKNHNLYKVMAEARTCYWDIYMGKTDVPDGLRLFKYAL